MDLVAWFEMAKSGGIVSTFVLGVGIVFIWLAYREEIEYSRRRDKETLELLATLTLNIKDGVKEGGYRDDKILTAIGELKQIVLEHGRNKG